VSKARVATVWLDGCSGCHMSILDMDERLIDIAAKADVVFGPYVDAREFPENVDVTLVEGAVSSEEDLHKIRMIRSRTKILVALGDCAINGNVPAMRNPFGLDAVFARGYLEEPNLQPQVPCEVVPKLLPVVRPIHEFVAVDVFIPGCPPAADTIFYALAELAEGRMPDLSDRVKFG
jgi:NAD-reducing hydrogenase small subunit